MRSHFSGFRQNFYLFRLCIKILISDILTESVYIYIYSYTYTLLSDLSLVLPEGYFTW
jgi:hypothetical protein